MTEYVVHVLQVAARPLEDHWCRAMSALFCASSFNFVECIVAASDGCDVSGPYKQKKLATAADVHP